MHTNALDEVLALPSDHAARVALRAQQVIAEETGVASVIDPLGGSWFVEWLTDEGYCTSELADAAFAFQRRLDEGDDNLVPLIMDAVRASATVGEVSRTLQAVWGTYQEAPRL